MNQRSGRSQSDPANAIRWYLEQRLDAQPVRDLISASLEYIAKGKQHSSDTDVARYVADGTTAAGAVIAIAGVSTTNTSLTVTGLGVAGAGFVGQRLTHNRKPAATVARDTSSMSTAMNVISNRLHYNNAQHDALYNDWLRMLDQPAGVTWVNEMANYLGVQSRSAKSPELGR